MDKLILKKSEIYSLFNCREEDANKGCFGRSLLISGSYGMAGACIICAKANIYCGTGICDIACEEQIYSAVTSCLNEAICTPLSQSFDINSRLKLKNSLDKANCVVVGCGMGYSDYTLKILCFLAENCKVPIIIDADGINVLSENIELIKEFNCPVLLTPHPGEMSRLCNKSIENIQKSRETTAIEFSKNYHCITVLKGHNTVISDENGNLFVNPTGNPGMATGGTGDMLCGMISSFVSQGMTPLNAAKAGVYLHGLAGDLTAKKISQYCLTPTKMIDILPEIFLEIEENLKS